MVFFTEDYTFEYEIMHDHVSTIPMLEPQWKIIHEFKPIRYKNATAYPSPVSLRVFCKKRLVLKISFPFPNMRLVHQDASISCPAPSLGEWSRIEISHERDEKGKYTLAMSVGNREVGSVDMESQILRNLTDIKIYIGPKDSERHFQHGCIRGLYVLNKP